MAADSGATKTKRINNSFSARLMRYSPFYIMFAPVMITLIIFYYWPMLGIRYALYDIGPITVQNPTYVGFDNFKELFQTEAFWRAFNNTLILSLGNLILSMVCCVVIALLINEIGNQLAKKFVQTVIYLPHFLSWVVVASIFTIILAPTDGVFNQLLFKLGLMNPDDPVYWLADAKYWRTIWYIINRWRETGWGTIIFLTAITGISPELYEAAEIDGAGRLKQTWYITLPSLMNTILIVFILQLAKIMNIFESVFALLNSPTVYPVGEVIQTYTYRIMNEQQDYGFSTAVGLFKSVVSLILVSIAEFASNKVRGRGII